MKSHQRVTYFGLVLILVAGCTAIGCRKTDSPGPSTTAAPSTTVPARTVPPTVELPSTTAPATTETPAATAPATTEAPATTVPATTEAPATTAPTTEVAMTPQTALGNLVPIDFHLPPPAFRGTPVPQTEPHVEKPLGTARPPFLAPEGTVNLARGMAVTTSDPAPTAGEVDFVTDGAKEASDFGYLELHPGSQWVQIDLGKKSDIYAVVVWHNHADARVYRDVIVQVGDDPDFLDAQTVFNNDYDDTSGLGIGQDMGYVETAEGKLIDCKGIQGRYVRLYTKGNNIDAKNHYTEVDVYGKPAG